MSKVKCKYRKLDHHIQLVGPDMAAEEGYEQKGTSFASLEDHPPQLEEKAGLEDPANPDSFINVPTTDLDPIAVALAKCESYVLKPYRVVLIMLGWISFSRSGDSVIMKLLRAVLIIVWLLVIITTCITQILSCFRRDSTLPAVRMNRTFGNETKDVRALNCEEHVISAFILTDLLLIASYLFGWYLFSREETEYLSNLASKVFIKNADDKSRSNHLVWTIVVYFLCGLLWVFLSLCVRIMTTISVEMWRSDTIIVWRNDSDDPTTFSDGGKVVLLILDLIGFLFFDLVYVAAVMNYAAQSEMNIYLLTAIRKLVQDKGYGPEIGLEASIKDIIECRKYLRVLNGKTATATALILFNLGSAGITAIINLEQISQSPVNFNNSTALATVTAGFNVILWVGLVVFPFIQAARVTDACLQVKAMGPELRARPQLYASTPQLELDSYVTLTQAVKLRATMFGIPIYPWMWWAIFCAVSFLALILFQTGVYSFTVYL